MANYLNIFDFSDYQAYLKAWLKGHRKQKTSNLTRLARIVQVHATFLSHVLGGSKHLSLEQAASLSEHLGHSVLERDYFFNMIQIDRAGSQILKSYWQEKKSQIESEKNKLSKRFEKHKELNLEQKAIFYSSWIYAAVWVSTGIKSRQMANEIAEALGLQRAKIIEVLDFLTQAGLCNEQDGRYTMTNMHVHVPNESPFVVKHHINWRVKSIEKMDNRTSAELFFTAPMSIAKKDFANIREKLNQLIKEVVEVTNNSEAEELVCLNIDFFNSEKR